MTPFSFLHSLLIPIRSVSADAGNSRRSVASHPMGESLTKKEEEIGQNKKSLKTTKKDKK
jgi:hypothetical protein